MSLLVIVPFKPDLHPDLKQRSQDLAWEVVYHPANKRTFGSVELALHADRPPNTPQNAGKFYHQARVRNEAVATHLKPHHEYVLWVDADLTQYPADLPARLYEANPGGITAPMVHVEGKSQFYDTLGFIQNGRRLLHTPPYFRNGQAGQPLVDLDSVGCIYLIPAWILHHVSYDSLPPDREADHPTLWATGHTDHWPVMRYARANNIPIRCLTAVRADHANLPDYGEGWH